MAQHTLSVTMPNYNHAHSLARAIEAIVSQSRPPDEFIILDDGSTDNSVEIIQSYAQRYPYIRFIQHTQNRGVIPAINHLLSIAAGDYLYEGAADDYVLPEFFQNAMSMADRYPHAGIIFGKLKIIDPAGRLISLHGIEQWQCSAYIPPERYLRDCLESKPPIFSLSGTTIYRRTALEEIHGFRHELLSWTDTFASQAIALKHGACYLAEFCTAWTSNPDSFSTASRSNAKNMLDVAARAAWLMRSPEFRDRFPASYAAQWEDAFRRVNISRCQEQFKGSFNSAKKICTPILAEWNWFGKLLSYGFSLWIKIERQLWAWILGWILRRYPGDLSCYDRQSPE